MMCKTKIYKNTNLSIIFEFLNFHFFSNLNTFKYLSFIFATFPYKKDTDFDHTVKQPDVKMCLGSIYQKCSRKSTILPYFLPTMTSDYFCYLQIEWKIWAFYYDKSLFISSIKSLSIWITFFIWITFDSK